MKKKYNLINKTTNEEHICSKVTIGRFDYYLSEIIGNIKRDDFGYDFHGNIFQWTLEFQIKNKLSNILADTNKKVIATNNPSLNIPQVIDEVEELAEKLTPDLIYKKYVKTGFVGGYNNSQLTHPNSDKDMLSFGGFCRLYDEKCRVNNTIDVKNILELLEDWKSQQTKTIYYK